MVLALTPVLALISGSTLAALLVAEALALGLGLWLWRRRPWSSRVRVAVQEAVSGPAEDPEQRARRLLAGEPELAALYEGLGYSLDFEREGQELLVQIKSHIVVEIPDEDAFRQAVAKARYRLEEAASKADPDPLREALAQRCRDPLLLDVSEPGRSRQEILERLGRAPVDELLPLVEQMALLRDGKVVWRTPVAVDVLHKKAAEAPLLLRRLQELEGWVRGSRIRRDEEARRLVLEAGTGLRRAVEKGSLYLVTPVKALEESYADWYHQRQNPQAVERRRALDRFLLELVQEQARQEAAPSEASEGASQETLERVTAQVQEYLHSPWLQTPRLAQLLLALLVSAEVSRLAPPPGRKPSSALEGFQALEREIASGRFDAPETVLRLRRWEEQGIILSSLVFGLLRQLEGANSLRRGPA